MTIKDISFYTRIGRASELSDKGQRRLYRFFEILPGFLSWGTLLVLIFLAWQRPVWVAVFIIVFDLYWLTRTIYLFTLLKVSYNKMNKNLATDWIEQLDKLKPPEYSIKLNNWQELYHLVFLPMYKENLNVVNSTFEALSKVDYPKDKIVVVLATEERAGSKAEEIVEVIKNKFSHQFGNFFVTKHPDNIQGELAGKGSNLAWAGKEIKKFIDEQNIPYERIIVSALDIDTQVPQGYFSRLAHQYLITKNPTHASYQPIPFFNNNIWEAPAMARVMSYSSTFWHMMQQERPQQQTTFSSHSMSFKALVDVGFWQSNMVSEDSRIFFQCLLRYDGDYSVASLYYPVSMDANVAKSLWHTMKNQYKQQRRWAWGVENIPYTAFGFLKNKLVPLRKKIRYLFNLGEGFHSWATNSLIIFLMGWLPLLIGGTAFHATTLSYSLPKLTQILLTISMVGIIVSAILSILLMPPTPNGRSRFNKGWLFMQWFLTPIVLMIFSSFPALEAQTRLMFGKYMGFWVTEKSRRD